MNRLLIYCITTICLLAPGPIHAQRRQFPDTREGIHVFSDQMQGQMSPAQCAFAAARFAGCQKMLLDDVRALRVYNPDFIVLHYQLACGNGPASFIDGNEWISDWGYVATRDSWFMHSGISRLHMAQWDWYLMDITNPSYRNYWVEKCIERMRNTECDGVFADSFTIDGYFDALTPSHPWFTDPDQCRAHWIPRLEAYATYIRASLSATPERFYFLPNLGALVTGWDTTDYDNLGDGGMVEGFGAWGYDSYLDPPDWKLQMDRTLSLARANKIVLCQSYTSDVNLRERMFLTGCYLLIKGDRTFLYLMGDAGEALAYYPEYGIPIGAYGDGIPDSVDDLFDRSSGCYRRNYTNGIVLVNPAEEEARISDLGGSYYLVSAHGGGAVDESGGHGGFLSYREMSSVVLPAHSAAIMLKETPSSQHTVLLSTDKTSYSSADTLTLHWSITRGAASASNKADAYIAVITPGGRLYFYRGRFSERTTSIARSLPVRDIAGDLGPFNLSGLPAGEYRWYGVLTAPGTNPLRAANWASNLASAQFKILQDVLAIIL